MLGIIDVLKSLYLGLNIGITIWYPFTIGYSWFNSKRYTLGQLLTNLLFPLTIIMYPLGYILERTISLLLKINTNKVLLERGNHYGKR